MLLDLKKKSFYTGITPKLLYDDVHVMIALHGDLSIKIEMSVFLYIIQSDRLKMGASTFNK